MIRTATSHPNEFIKSALARSIGNTPACIGISKAAPNRLRICSAPLPHALHTNWVFNSGVSFLQKPKSNGELLGVAHHIEIRWQHLP